GRAGRAPKLRARPVGRCREISAMRVVRWRKLGRRTPRWHALARRVGWAGCRTPRRRDGTTMWLIVLSALEIALPAALAGWLAFRPRELRRQPRDPGV